MVDAEQPQPGQIDGGGSAGGDDSGLFQSRDDGQLHFVPETAADTFPVTAPTNATPLREDEPEGVVPPSPLWAMKERRHEQRPHIFGHPERIRACIGAGDAAVYVMDDGARHRMIGRRVGATGDGCVYSLVARITRATHEALVDGAIDGRQAFLDGSDIALVGTVETPGVSNLFDVAFYADPSDIPDDYLPPSGFIAFAEDLPSAER